MPKQASLNEELEYEGFSGDVLDRIHEELDEIVSGYEDTEHYVDLKRNFAGEDVFIQTEKYNVFINTGGLNFWGLEKDSELFEEPENDEQTLEAEVLDYLEDVYDIEDLESNLNWF